MIGVITMSWDNVKITPESVNEFFNNLDMDTLLENMDRFFKEIDENEKKKAHEEYTYFTNTINHLITSTNHDFIKNSQIPSDYSLSEHTHRIVKDKQNERAA